MAKAQTQDTLGVIGTACIVTTAMQRSFEFNEALLGNEELFMFYNFPIHSTPSDEEVIERFEELLVEAATEESLLNKLAMLIKDQADKL